ncbi:MAG: hypothetical protein RMJ67_09465 [Elusimicrobiota bacterium]|nr:hypothetical protein [Endomicrobiia bacterium]MDW7972159.1 hypothetical protein [Thermodesulfovibrio sp.]MDW8166722.1 hypothetical protein [Elusimicrobiota bacterium]
MKKVVIIIVLLIFATNSLALDIGCIVGACERQVEAQSKIEKIYECECPPKDTLGTVINVFGVLTLPFQFFSNKPRFDVGLLSLESLIKKGCKCKLKVQKEEVVKNTTNTEDAQEEK